MLSFLSLFGNFLKKNTPGRFSIYENHARNCDFRVRDCATSVRDCATREFDCATRERDCATRVRVCASRERDCATRVCECATRVRDYVSRFSVFDDSNTILESENCAGIEFSAFMNFPVIVFNNSIRNYKSGFLLRVIEISIYNDYNFQYAYP